jgi:transcriptional regulator with XRE-family HTH domain
MEAGFDTRRKLADAADVHTNTVLTLERDRGYPGIKITMRLCETLGITPEVYLYGKRHTDLTKYRNVNYRRSAWICRLKAGMSQQQLAMRSGVDICTISALETGKRDTGIYIVMRLAETLGVGLDEYLGFTE